MIDFVPIAAETTGNTCMDFSKLRKTKGFQEKAKPR